MWVKKQNKLMYTNQQAFFILVALPIEHRQADPETVVLSLRHKTLIIFEINTALINYYDLFS